MLRRRMKKNQRSYNIFSMKSLRSLTPMLLRIKSEISDFAIGQQKTGWAWEIKKAKQRGGEWTPRIRGNILECHMAPNFTE